MPEHEFSDYSEIAAMPVRSQQDYLMKYIAGRSLNQYYAYFRDKMPPKEDGSKYTSGGLTTHAEQQKAREKTCSDFNKRKWTDSDDGELRKLRKHIEHFLQGLNIDPNLFKKGHSYQMTEELMEFFDFILDDHRYITSQIVKRKFNNVSNASYRHIFSCLLAALNAAPCTEDEKEQAKEKFIALMDENNIDLSFQYHSNKTVDAILRIIWEKATEKGWQPKCTRIDEDCEWAVVTERVYHELFERGLLMPKPDGVGGERPHLRSDLDFPM